MIRATLLRDRQVIGAFSGHENSRSLLAVIAVALDEPADRIVITGENVRVNDWTIAQVIIDDDSNSP